ncbi:hypothetical protein [Rhizobium sp. EC-SD404]|uniref:hypothetical protein n=1 Tax=Rhizobium sp. EC-SD404 TaxID=2038389 RepID=UPI001257C6D8|nr:hypothetical protein [Rhizobium sp. EC-SD404]VVT24894.1 conserved exported hypothetical protein [Rhizobium sp. EC-SD404]
MHPTRRTVMTSAATVAFLSATSGPLSFAASARAQGTDRATVRSISAMAFGPNGRLVIADWRSDALHALALPKKEPAAEASFNVKALDAAIAKAEGLEPGRIKPTAVAMEPSNGHAVVAYKAGASPEAPARLAMVNPSGAVEIVDPAELTVSTQPLSDRPGDALIWNETPARTLLVTDIVPHELPGGGTELLVAGLANADFSSTLRRVPYPFTGEIAVSEIEMYHTVHNQIETRAPIRAMSIVELGGEEHLLAAYTCTPLVTAPLSALVDGASVRAKTIAELGFGNTPLSIMPFDIDYHGETSKWVMVANAAKAADLISLDAIAAANAAPGIKEPVKVPFETTKGVIGAQMPITNLVGMVDQGPQFLLALRRGPQSGELELVSFRKGAFFRLSDFINEYDLPSYEYGEDSFQQDYIRPFHRMMKTDEGHADLIE